MGRLNADMRMVTIMQEFGWTYWEYMNTPSYIIELVLAKLRRDKKEEELAAKRERRG